MDPWNADDSASRVLPAERALSFISKSLHDVQKSANRDIKLMKQRAKSFKDLASSLDKEWEKGVGTLKLPLPRSSGNFLNKIRETGPPFSPIYPLSSSGQDSNFLRNLKPTFPSFRRSQSDPSLDSRLTDETTSSRRSVGGPFSSFQGYVGSNSGREVISKYGQGGQQNGEWLDWIQPKPFPDTRVNNNNIDWIRGTERAGRSGRFRGKIDNWEPIRRAKESVKESLKELELTTLTSKTPAEFFENLKKTEFFENVKKHLMLRTMKSSGFGAKTELENEVAPLDVTELLENLVRQSEPLLDQLGVKKDISEKVCEVLRSYKRKDHTAIVITKDREISTTTREGGKSTDDLDLRIASIVQSTGYRYKGGLFGEQTAELAESNDVRRHVAIVTTASLPWMTGTAVNPLFRAAYLAKNGKQNVTLLVPWLSQDDQEIVYPHRMTFSSPVEQEIYVRNWLEARIGFRPDFKIAFYPGRFSTEERSILAVGDISQFIPDKDADVAVLEEPEHLTWYYHGKRWTDKFKHVVGVVHTNYLEYIRREKNGPFRAFLVEHVNNWMARIYCHKVIRLSGATQMFPKSEVCNVHGVSPRFLLIGEKIASHGEEGKVTFSKGAYYLGKMVWSKGYRELVDLLNLHKGELGSMDVDVYGSGEDSADVEATSRKLGLRVNFHQGLDHADDSFHRYKVFINPSLSDVVCTTTAEALAMGKNVVCADHPSNDFFQSFPNCYVYKTPEEFVQKVKEAMTSEPVPLTSEQRYLLSWEAATDRFLQCAGLDNLPPKNGSSETTVSSSGDEVAKKKKAMSLSVSVGNLSDMLDRGLAFTHFFLSGIEPARRMSGALPGTMHPDVQLCKDLSLLPPSVQRPIYTW